MLFMFLFLNLDALMEKKKYETRCYEYVPVLSGNTELKESLEYKEAKKPYRAIPLVQVLKCLRAPIFFFFSPFGYYASLISF